MNVGVRNYAAVPPDASLAVRLDALSESFRITPPMKPLQPNNWLVTPPLYLGTDRYVHHDTNISFACQSFHPYVCLRLWAGQTMNQERYPAMLGGGGAPRAR